jgi:hypothetical protein
VYFLSVLGLTIPTLLFRGVKFEGLDHEFEKFVEEYKDTSLWWLTSLTTSIVALTVGAGAGILVDVAVLSIFFLPALYYFTKRYPFSLDCDYRATTDEGRTAHGRDMENIAQMDRNGECEIELQVQTGAAIDEFRLELEPPEGVSPRNIPTKVAEIELTEENIIKGKASPGMGQFSFDLYLEKIGNIFSGRNLLLIKDHDTGRTLETIRIIDSS